MQRRATPSLDAIEGTRSPLTLLHFSDLDEGASERKTAILHSQFSILHSVSGILARSSVRRAVASGPLHDAMPTPPDALPPFPGFSDEALQFLRDLKKNNDRDWFKPQKTTYDDDLRDPMRMLVADLSRRLPAEGVPLTGEPNRSVFRIYRDVRFSKNKNPYKTNVAAALHRGGQKGAPGGLYIHVEPGGCFLAAGYWQMDPKLLRRWRERLVADPDGWQTIAAQAETDGLTLGSGPTSTLKRMPRGFSDHTDSPVAEPLRWKGATLTLDLADEAVQTPAFTDRVVTFAKASLPFLAWGWDLVDEAVPS